MVRSAILKRRWLRTARPTSTALASFRPVPSLACKYVHVSEILRPRLVHFFCFARAYNRNLRNCGPRTTPSLPPSTPRGGCLFVLLICVSPIDSTGHAHLGVHPVDRSHRHDGARTPSQRHGWRARPSRVRRGVSPLTVRPALPVPVQRRLARKPSRRFVSTTARSRLLSSHFPPINTLDSSGLVFSTALPGGDNSTLQQVIEWNNFVGSGECILFDRISDALPFPVSSASFLPF